MLWHIVTVNFVLIKRNNDVYTIISTINSIKFIREKKFKKYLAVFFIINYYYYYYYLCSEIFWFSVY